MSAKRLPQLVILTFDDSVNDLNKGLYQVLSLTNRLFLYVLERESSVKLKSVLQGRLHRK